MRKRFPDLHLNINVLKIEEALNYLLLEKGECIAISYRFNHSGIDFEPLASGDLYCIVPINHPLATRNSIAAAEISRYFERTGLRTAGQMGGHKRPKLEPHREFLEACHAEKPDVTLQALCDRLLSERSVKADTSLMSRFLRRIGLTPKKRRSFAREQDRPDVKRHRIRWRKHQQRVDPSRLVFIDETWTKTNMTRLYGWA